MISNAYSFLQDTFLFQSIGLQVQNIYSWVFYLSPDSVARKMLHLQDIWPDSLNPEEPFKFLHAFSLPREKNDVPWIPFLNFVPYPAKQLGFAFIAVGFQYFGNIMFC